MDKLNFIRACAKAREAGFTEKNVRAGWRINGNGPISRRKALSHLEIQEDKLAEAPTTPPQIEEFLGSDDTPKTSRHVRDFSKNKTSQTRRQYKVIAKGFED